ncbi:reverse transcriptase domain-containing protein [Tanacetum coccineum]
MCDKSDYAIEAVLGQRIDKHFQLIHYASKTMKEAQENYTTTENELSGCRLHIRQIPSILSLIQDYHFNRSLCPTEGIMVLPQPQEKSSKLGSTGQISSAMHIDWSKLAMPVNEPVTSPQGMKHLKSISKSVRYLVFVE